MTATRAAVTESWLLALVSAADQHELLMVGVRLCAAGQSQALARCLRCHDGGLPPMKLTQVVRHLRETEAEHQMALAGQDGPNAALHGPADLIPADDVAPAGRGGAR